MSPVRHVPRRPQQDAGDGEDTQVKTEEAEETADQSEQPGEGGEEEEEVEDVEISDPDEDPARPVETHAYHDQAKGRGKGKSEGKGKGKVQEGNWGQPRILRVGTPPADWPDTLPFYFPERDVQIEHSMYQVLSKQIAKAYKNGHPSVLHRLRHDAQYRDEFIAKFGYDILERLPHKFRMPAWTTRNEYASFMDSIGGDPRTGHMYADLERYRRGDRKGIETPDLNAKVNPLIPDLFDFPPGYVPGHMRGSPSPGREPSSRGRGSSSGGKGGKGYIPRAAAPTGAGRSGPYQRVRLTPAPGWETREAPQEYWPADAPTAREGFHPETGLPLEPPQHVRERYAQGTSSSSSAPAPKPAAAKPPSQSPGSLPFQLPPGVEPPKTFAEFLKLKEAHEEWMRFQGGQ